MMVAIEDQFVSEVVKIAKEDHARYGRDAFGRAYPWERLSYLTKKDFLNAAARKLYRREMNRCSIQT